jgi:uncharacterized membrane protein YfcA
MAQAGPIALRFARSTAVYRTLLLVPVLGAVLVVASIATAPGGDRLVLVSAAFVAAAAGMSATSIGVFGGVLVPGLLLLGVEPKVAAPLSLLLQVIVIPLGATSHAAVGNVQRAIAVPLIVGGVIGSITGALLASTVPAAITSRAVAAVIVVVGFIVLATLRTGYAAGHVEQEQVHPARIGGIGTIAGFASGISGAGWGPIGVKLLILSRIDPRHAIGSSLVGRVAMAVAAVVTYALSAAATGGVTLEPRLFVVLLAASAGAMMPGTVLLSRLGRGRASALVAVLSIGLALPSLLGGGR